MISFVANNCLALDLYGIQNRQYNSPFIGSLFVNDEQFVKLCCNLNHYLEITPVFAPPSKESKWFIQSGSEWYRHPAVPTPYPVMWLGDIEIHWIHEKDPTILMEKFNRRLERFKLSNPIFLLSCGDLLNNHNSDEFKTMIDNFTSLRGSYYLSRYREDAGKPNRWVVDRWVGSSDSRDSSHRLIFAENGNRLKDFQDILPLNTTVT